VFHVEQNKNRVDPSGSTRAGGGVLTVIIDASEDEGRAAGLLAALTPASVEGVVREVLIAGVGTKALADALCEETGAEAAADVASAASRARSEWVLVLPARIRFRDGWVERLKDHLSSGSQPAVLYGMRPDSLFARRPYGVLVRRQAASVGAGVEALRRQERADRVRLD
jgi:hypothetical protein